MAPRNLVTIANRDDLAPTLRLLVAAFPSSYAREDFYRQALSACATYGLQGRPFPLSRYHLSLCCIREGREFSAGLIEWARSFCGQIASNTPPIETTLDQRMSFSGSARKKPLVMCSEKPSRTLLELFRDFYSSPEGSERALTFVPHVTLLYDEQCVMKRTVEPVSWTIHEIVLLISYLGESRYEPLDRFPLCG